MKQYPFLDLAFSNAPYMEELKAAACEVIERGRYLHSVQTELLEQEFSLPYFEFVYDEHWDLGHGWSGDMPK